MSKTNTPKTPEDVRREFVEAGVSVAGWARANGFSRDTVIDVLRGQSAGLRGQGHEVAVALGLKDGHVIDVTKFKPRKTTA